MENSRMENKVLVKECWKTKIRKTKNENTDQNSALYESTIP